MKKKEASKRAQALQEEKIFQDNKTSKSTHKMKKMPTKTMNKTKKSFMLNNIKALEKIKRYALILDCITFE